MIWIHGGGFTTGSSDPYQGQVMVAQGGVIVVTINYRLNIFGFLTTGNSDLPGNYGLWDQKLAIQWVKDNIAEYGGDPNSITLFGESAGGRSVSFQMFSPQNDNSLFQRAITESGSALSLTFLNRDPSEVISNITEIVKCKEKQSNLVQCLREIPQDTLLNATRFTNRSFPFFPIVDNDFLPHDLGKLLAEFNRNNGLSISTKRILQNYAGYDLFSGWNDQDGLIYMPTLLDINMKMTGKDLNKGLSADVLSKALNYYPFYTYGGDQKTKQAVIDTLINFYMNTPNKLIKIGRAHV